MYRMAFYQTVLLFGFFISSDWFEVSDAEDCVKKEDVYASE